MRSEIFDALAMANQKLVWALVFLALLLTLARPSSAHHGPLGGLVVNVKQSAEVDVLIDLDAVTLGDALRLDRDGNNVVDDGELALGKQAILDYIERRFEITNGGEPCPVSRVEKWTAGGSQRRVKVLEVHRCVPPLAAVVIENQILMEEAGGHRHLGQVQVGSRVATHVFTRQEASFEVDASNLNPAVQEEDDVDNFPWWSILLALLPFVIVGGIVLGKVRARPGCVFLLCAGLFFAVPAEAGPKEDLELIAELELTNPKALPLLREAIGLARDGDHAAAAQLYNELRKFAPEESVFIRRQCASTSRAGRKSEALALCAEAVEVGGTYKDHGMLAHVHMSNPRTSAGAKLAAAHAEAALTLNPECRACMFASCSAGEYLNDTGLLSECVSRLEHQGDKDHRLHMMQMRLALSLGDLDGAKEALDRARVKGLPDASFHVFNNAITEMRPLWYWWEGPFLVFMLLWSLFTGLLSGAGVLMNKKIHQLRGADGSWETEGIEKSLRWRRLHRRLLWLWCFWIILAEVLALVFVPFALAALGSWMVAVKLMSLARVTTSLIALLILMVFIFRKTFYPCAPLRGELEPVAALEALEVINHSVAEGLEADPAGFVDIGPGRAFSVVEIGSPAMHLEGERVRCISADNSVLQSLPVVALKSALAVEYGHLSDLDPAGGGFCRNMRRANEASLLAMVRSGLDRPTNLRWMALRFRAWSFGLMSSGGESLQCHLSDRWTVERFGAEAFEVAQAAMGADRKDVADRLASVRAYACPDPPRADRGAWGLMADLLKGVG